MKTYEIVRIFYDGTRKTIKEGLTLNEAKEHCSDPETASHTCSEETRKTVGSNQIWFDAFYEE